LGIYKIQIYLFALIFLCACGENFKALKAEKTYNFFYNGFEKSLIINGEKSDFILVFFTKECGVCLEQIAVLKKLAKNNFKIFIILANSQNQEDAKTWAESKNLTGIIFYQTKAVRYLAQAVGGVYGVPVLSIFKEGKLKEKFLGLTPLGVLQKSLKDLEL